jgi:hypothetical protein
MNDAAPDASPTPLRAATQGFVELAGWFTGLAGKHAVEVARKIDQDRFDATSTFARAAALPLIGWTAFLNEVIDAASVITYPPQHVREETSDDFVGLDQWTATQTLHAHDLVNGFGERLPTCVDVSVESKTVGEDLIFRLRARNIPHACVGVYRGTVRPDEEQDGITVWLVIP